MTMRILGIAGPSGAGKSYLAQAVLDAGLAESVARLSLDDYYLDHRQLPPIERAALNFDEPDAVDSTLLLRHVQALRQGQAINRPCYDFDTHTRREESQRITPVALLIVEGLYVLYWRALRRYLSLSVYVDTADALCLQRRLARDIRERGRSADSVQTQYLASVRPMAEHYVLPTRRYADLVIAGDTPINEAVARIRALQEEHL